MHAVTRETSVSRNIRALLDCFTAASPQPGRMADFTMGWRLADSPKSKPIKSKSIKIVFLYMGRVREGEKLQNRS